MSFVFETLRLLALALLGTQPVAADRGVATVFGDAGDSLAGGHLYCTGKKMEPGQLACAHRTLPCGTVVMLENPRTGRFAACQVLDRGPFGAKLESGRWAFKIHEKDPGQWRGVIDLSPAVSQALDHNGRERVRLYYKEPRRGHRITRREFQRSLAASLDRHDALAPNGPLALE